MRKMKRINSNDEPLEVIEHIILKNFWEYYVINNSENTDDIKLCYVLGFENEMGDVYIPEIKPYIISKTKQLNDVMPAPNYEWID